MQEESGKGKKEIIKKEAGDGEVIVDNVKAVLNRPSCSVF